jgi:type I restriction enzyme S subunit
MAKYKAYPEYKDSGVEWLGEIPSSWDMWKLSHAYEAIGSGTTPTSSNELWFQGDIPWVTTGELRETVINDTFKKVSSFTLQTFSALKIHPAGSIIIAMYGATIGRLGILGVDATTNQACCVMTKSNMVNNKYLYYWLQAFREDIIKLSSGGGQPNINQEKVASLKISSPAWSDQATIVCFLDYETAKIDNLIEKQQQLIELLKEKRQAVISHAVTKGLNTDVEMKDSGVEWLGEVPEHWRIKRCKHLFNFVTSGSRGWAGYYADEGSLFFRIANLTRDTINPKLASIQYVTPPKGSEGERSQIKENDLLISITADLGSVCTADKSIIGGYVSQHVSLCRPNELVTSSRWLAYFVLSDTAKEQLQGAGYGGTKVQLSLEDIRDLYVAYPPKKEQVKIAYYIDKQFSDLDYLDHSAQKLVELLKERRTALISAAVTGKIDVRDWVAPDTSDIEVSQEAIA